MPLTEGLKKTIFTISKMDCPSEEYLIRMSLDDLPNIQSLEFDIPNRKLTVYHDIKDNMILEKLVTLNLGTTLTESINIQCFNAINNQVKSERKLLWKVLVINFSFFGLELVTGIISGSMGLLADSLDMLADSIVYSLALWATGGSNFTKKNVARWSGYFQLTLALLGFTEAVKRFWGYQSIPDYKIMMTVSTFSLVANVLCLYMLQKSKSKEAHIRASMIFTSSDVFVNLGIIAAGCLVLITNSTYPDIIVGTIVFLIVGKGAFSILKLSK